MRMSKGMMLAGALIMAATAAEAGSQTKAKVDKNARLIACYKEVTVPAKYHVKKILIKGPERQYWRRNGRVELVEYPAVYKEEKTLIKPEHVVMQQISCD